MLSAAPANAYLPTPIAIGEVRRDTADTFTWTFRGGDAPLPPPSAQFAFAPGQFNMLYVHGVGEVPISISGDPGRPDELVHTIRGVGTVTRAMQGLVAGDVVGVRGPYGSSWPLAEARGGDLVIVAGGLGLAPLRPAILHALSHRDDYDRVVVLVGARTPDDMLFADELQRWRGRFDCTVEATVDRAGRAWRGPVGVVTRLVQEARFDPEGATALLCGPEIMMRLVARALIERGVSGDRLFVSMERSMKCGVRLCGHCQWGPAFVCKDGPVHRWSRVEPLFAVREI